MELHNKLIIILISLNKRVKRIYMIIKPMKKITLKTSFFRKGNLIHSEWKKLKELKINVKMIRFHLIKVNPEFNLSCFKLNYFCKNNKRIKIYPIICKWMNFLLKWRKQVLIFKIDSLAIDQKTLNNFKVFKSALNK